jgi:hypothetical protein
VLAAHRGLTAEELRLATPGFEAAVRWALYAESNAQRLGDLREVVTLDPPDELTGPARSTFMANRKLARTELAALEAELYPDDEDGAA